MKKKYWLVIAAALVLLLTAGGAYFLFYPVSGSEQATVIYIDRDDTRDSVANKIGNERVSLLLKLRNYTPRTGFYEIPAATGNLQLYRQLSRGQQTPIDLIVNNPRTLPELTARLASQLMIEESEINELLYDSAFISGLSTEGNASTRMEVVRFDTGLPALFIPNTYEVYWNISAQQLLKRMYEEYKAFWNDSRRAKAKQQGLTPIEVSILASIVDSETAYTPEKPTVASLYLNRLRRGMLLQSDPTVIYALQDFTIRRVLNKHLRYPSPYNTYQVKGLPPGPIRIPSVSGIEAVLNAPATHYIYMCAKEDFSGSHRFAETHQEHQRNAKLYQAALNKRNIK